MASPPEASITINGTRLTSAQAMTLRVALDSFHHEMSKPGALGQDEDGLFMALAYRHRASEIINLLTKKEG